MTDDTPPNPNPQPSIAVDWERYADHLADWDVPDSVKQEFLETLLGIVTGFVDLGFGLSPYQQSCGQQVELTRLLEAMVVGSEDHISNKFEDASSDLSAAENGEAA